MINGPPLDALSSFAALADELHFTRAAARLHVAQPALTKRIQQLERALGVRLFLRTRRSVRLTSEGEVLIEKARQVIRAAEDLATTARRLSDGETGRLRIGFTPSAPHHVLPALMQTFRRQHPAIRCMLTEASSEDQVRQILDGELDVGILRPPAVRPASLACTTFLEEPYVAVLPRNHRLASAPRRGAQRPRRLSRSSSSHGEWSPPFTIRSWLRVSRQGSRRTSRRKRRTFTPSSRSSRPAVASRFCRSRQPSWA